MIIMLAFTVGLCLVLAQVQGLDNGVGATPAMGWNSWNFFRCNINETIVKDVADAMVASGLRDLGYEYVVIDDCWQQRRGPDGVIQPFADKFPSGMRALADYVHSKGLKFGLYTDAGNKTCEGYPGSWGHEDLDAQTYANWGVDFVKYDYCGMEKSTVSVQESYTRLRDALNKTGRPFYYSMCSWGHGQPWLWGKQVGHSWRVSADLYATWDAPQTKSLYLPNFLQPVLSAVEAVQGLAQYAGPGGFNDPDMLVVGLDGMYPYGIVEVCPPHVKGCKPGDYISRDRWGRQGGLSYTEQKTHFALWCILTSPLILGNDPRNMSAATLSILKAEEYLAVNQDPLAQQGRLVWTRGELQLWRKDLRGGSVALLLVNRGSSNADITVEWETDLHDLHRKWADKVEVEVSCKDKSSECKAWAKAGECEKNPGFMLDRCQLSCPKACSQLEWSKEPHSNALVRDLWWRQDLGVFWDAFTAEKVEPHEARLLTITFVAAGSKLQTPKTYKSISASHPNTSADSTAQVQQLRAQLTSLNSQLLHQQLAQQSTKTAKNTPDPFTEEWEWEAVGADGTQREQSGKLRRSGQATWGRELSSSPKGGGEFISMNFFLLLCNLALMAAVMFFWLRMRRTGGSLAGSRRQFY